MRNLLFLLFLLAGSHIFAQSTDNQDLVKSIADLNKALISRDTLRLRLLLRDDLHYYHSNGWQQSKNEVIEDLYNGKLTYKTINPTSQSVHFISKTLASVSSTAEVDAVMERNPIHLELNIIQMWAWKNGRWELFSRLSKRVEKQH